MIFSISGVTSSGNFIGVSNPLQVMRTFNAQLIASLLDMFDLSNAWYGMGLVYFGVQINVDVEVTVESLSG